MMFGLVTASCQKWPPAPSAFASRRKKPPTQCAFCKRLLSATGHIAKYRDMNISSNFDFPGNHAKIINSRIMAYLDLIQVVYCCPIANSNISSEIFESH